MERVGVDGRCCRRVSVEGKRDAFRLLILVLRRNRPRFCILPRSDRRGLVEIERAQAARAAVRKRSMSSRQRSLFVGVRDARSNLPGLCTLWLCVRWGAVCQGGGVVSGRAGGGAGRRVLFDACAPPVGVVWAVARVFRSVRARRSPPVCFLSTARRFLAEADGCSTSSIPGVISLDFFVGRFALVASCDRRLIHVARRFFKVVAFDAVWPRERSSPPPTIPPPDSRARPHPRGRPSMRLAFQLVKQAFALLLGAIWLGFDGRTTWPAAESPWLCSASLGHPSAARCAAQLRRFRVARTSGSERVGSLIVDLRARRRPVSSVAAAPDLPFVAVAVLLGMARARRPPAASAASRAQPRCAVSRLASSLRGRRLALSGDRERFCFDGRLENACGRLCVRRKDSFVALGARSRLARIASCRMTRIMRRNPILSQHHRSC